MNNIINLAWACNEAFENRLKISTKALIHATRVLNTEQPKITIPEATQDELIAYGLDMGLTPEELYNGQK